MNGCTTFAYVDSALASAHARVNPDDSTGDKYLDILTNARPAYFSRNVQGVMAVVNALMSLDDPRTYEQILGDFDITQVALVSGEEDNVFTPQMSVQAESQFFDEVTLPSKQWKHYGPFYVRPGGLIKVYTGGDHLAGDDVLNDADLYLKKGAQPSTSSYDCSSTSPHATEQCVLSGEGQYYVSVYAWTAGVSTKLNITVAYQSESAEYCGDGVVSELEVCDGDTRSCLEIDDRYIGGDANCNPSCNGWDETSCRYCGDGQIDTPELCDGNRVPCAEMDPSYVDGEAVCNGTCDGYDVTGCFTGEDLVVVEEQGTVQKDEWKHFGPFSHLDGEFKVSMTGTADADLYVRLGARPTATEYSCRPYKSSSAESCVLSGPGEYYVSVSGYKEENDFSLTITYRKEGESVCGDGVVEGSERCDGDIIDCVDLNSGYAAGQAVCNTACGGYDESACQPTAAQEEITHSGDLEKDVFDHFGPFNNLDGLFRVVMTGSGDMDLYVRKGAPPTTTDYDCRPWRSDSSEQCSLEGPGEYYVSIFGYRVGSYNVTISYWR